MAGMTIQVTLGPESREVLRESGLIIPKGPRRGAHGSVSGMPGLVNDCVRFAIANFDQFKVFVDRWRSVEIRKKLEDLEKSREAIDSQILELTASLEMTKEQSA